MSTIVFVLADMFVSSPQAWFKYDITCVGSKHPVFDLENEITGVDMTYKPDDRNSSVTQLTLQVQGWYRSRSRTFVPH